MGGFGGNGGLCLVARLAGLGAGCLGARQLLGRPLRPRRPQIWRLVQRPRGRAGRAGAEGRRRLPGRQALYGRRARICPARRRELQRRRPGVLVRRRFPRPLHRQRRNLRHEFDFGRASDACRCRLMRASPISPITARSWCASTTAGPMSATASSTCRCKTAKILGFYGNGRHQGEGRICRPRAACKAPTTAS